MITAALSYSDRRIACWPRIPSTSYANGIAPIRNACCRARSSSTTLPLARQIVPAWKMCEQTRWNVIVVLFGHLPGPVEVIDRLIEVVLAGQDPQQLQGSRRPPPAGWRVRRPRRRG